MGKMYSFFGVPLHSFTMQELLSHIFQSIDSKAFLHLIGMNADKVVMMKSNKTLFQLMSESTLHADGQSVVWAARLLGFPIPERTAGIDIMLELIREAEIRGLRVFFLGAEQQTLESMITTLLIQYPKLQIAGSHHGYFHNELNEQICQTIADSHADILFVGIPSPKKEIWIAEHAHLLQTPFCMGVGGSFDVIGGKLARAPLWAQRLGVEWVYRMIQEPRRLCKRYAYSNTLFMILVLIEWFKLKRYSRRAHETDYT